ncbi:YkvA family protein [Planococcus lenghuensis]|uniref:DUF1232 domain-containing protein n=1 Tax=Planococcus lenghuensis TaxID=2213202 RepID=A0A1Q2KZ71_9BACL|nr:DUF1232 domain-containing protein [Planococcus lenghuensis]AQQ53499.1 hypothetical protein B0X71_10725 [Planococcus lenghuensis]
MTNDQLTQPLPSGQEQNDFYQKLREQIRHWAENKGMASKVLPYVMLAPDMFHLMMKLAMDDRIDGKSKALVGSGILYFFLPLDFLPEFLLGPGGFLDDVVVAAFILNTILNNYPKEILEEHWAGEDDLLDTLQNLVESGNKLVSKIPAGGLAKRFLKSDDQNDNKTSGTA